MVTEAKDVDRNERLARLKGLVEQMNIRLSNVESYNRWILGILLAMWITIMLAIFFKG